MVRSKVTQKRYNESSEEESEDDYEARPPAKKKGKVSNAKVSQPRKILYKDDFSDNSLSDPEEDDNDSDFGAPKKSPKKKPTPKKSKKVVSKKKTPVKPTIKKGSKKPAKKSPAKKTPAKSSKKASNGTNGRHSGRKTAKKSYSYSSDEEEEDESEESEQSEEESDSDIEEVYVKPGKKGKKGSPKKLPKKNVAAKKKVKKPSHPPVGEMFVTAIKRLRDNPRKGSSMAAIKGFMAEEYGLYIQEFASKIKKYLTSAVADGEVIQTKGKGASGRFTVPGLKVKKKKRKNALTKKYDEDEVEYVAKKTARDENRAEAEKEAEERRQQRMEEAVRKELEKADRPKKVVQRKTEWEVEMIKGVKVTEEETFYKVKWFGATKMTWEPEENLRGCRDAIENFEIEEKTRIREEELEAERKKEMEENGTFEVSKILDVQFEGDKREFLVRWKYCKSNEDTWEPEENLGDSEELIQKFMERYDKTHGEHVSEKTLREGPKQVQRLTYTMKDIKGKSRKKAGWNGTRMTYYGQDDSDDEW